MKKSDLITSSLFIGIISGVFALNFLYPDIPFSTKENRTLQTLPQFSTKKLISGTFSKEIESYVTDQFLLRDKFIELKSNTEFNLGKQENNGVILTSNNTLIEGFAKPDYDLVDKNIGAINQFTQKISVPVYTAIIPTQSEVLKHTLPKNTPSYSQETLINYIYGTLENTVDVLTPLSNQNRKYIFYNTDHHWTSLGAYYGYEAIISKMNFTPVSLDSYNAQIQATNFNGTIYNKSGIRKAQSDTIHSYVENQEIMVNDGTKNLSKMLYNKDYENEEDKYALFLGGNDPQVTIKGEGKENLLIIKDSYTNAMVPFFIAHFKEIHLIDLRYMRDSVSEYLTQNEIHQVLICYSTGNFVEDKNLQLLN